MTRQVVNVGELSELSEYRISYILAFDLGQKVKIPLESKARPKCNCLFLGPPLTFPDSFIKIY